MKNVVKTLLPSVNTGDQDESVKSDTLTGTTKPCDHGLVHNHLLGQEACYYAKHERLADRTQRRAR